MNNASFRRIFLGTSLAGLALAPGSLSAGGIMLYEIGTPDVGLASAGYAARAQDASTVFKNPAGMNLLAGSQLQAGVQALYGNVKFTPNADTSPRLGNNDGGNAVGFLPAAGLFYVQELGEKWRVGLGTLSYFGLATQYDDNWVGRYYVQKSTLIGVSLLPTLSYKVNDWLSVGAGLNAMYGYLNYEMAVNNVLAPGLGDGRMELSDGTWGFGANVGVLIQASKDTRLGVTYLSAVNLDFKATPSFANLGPGFGALLTRPTPLNLGMEVPQSVTASVYHQLTDRLALMADLGWQNWSAFGRVDVGVDSANPTSLTTELNYQDTWHGAVGALYQLAARWQLTGGVAYDSSAVNDANRTVALPMGTALRLGTGVQWQYSPKLSLGAAYEFMWGGDMSVDQGRTAGLRGRLSGAYENTSFSFFTLNLNWKL